MIKQECIGIPDMIRLLMIFSFPKKIKIKAEIVLSTGGAYFLLNKCFQRNKKSFSFSQNVLDFVRRSDASLANKVPSLIDGYSACFILRFFTFSDKIAWMK